jgi:hypothetical protein
LSSTTLLPRASGQAVTTSWLPRLGFVAGVSFVALAIAAVSIQSTPLALLCSFVPGAALAVAWLRGRLAWVAFVIVVGGLSILGYGFANVPALPSLPVPLVDVLLVGTFLGLVLTGARWPVPRVPFVLAALLFGWASIRLLIDFRTWGSLAWRDYTTYVELSALFVGYWLMEQVGLDRWIRALSWIFVAVVIYGLVSFKNDAFLTFNPIVGLQRPVALLGHLPGVACLSAFFFFALVRPFGRKSPFLAALAIPPVFLLQLRGLYLALPLTILLLAVTSFAGARTPHIRRLLAATALAVIAGGLVLAAQPGGRFGAATPDLVVNQLSTLVGNSGTGTGSLNARTEWFTATIDRVRSHPGALVYGLGLGPDLAGGFSSFNDPILVRKPHDDYLEIFARLGLPSLLAFLVLLATSLRSIAHRNLLAGMPQEQHFQTWVLANSIIYLFIAGTQPLLAYPFGTIPLFAALGAGLAVSRHRHTRVAGGLPGRHVPVSIPSKPGSGHKFASDATDFPPTRDLPRRVH